jgi:hypothetical protein
VALFLLVGHDALSWWGGAMEGQLRGTSVEAPMETIIEARRRSSASSVGSPLNGGDGGGAVGGAKEA